MSSGFHDAHNHLHDDWLRPHRPTVFADLARADVRSGVVNGTCESDWAEVAALCAASGPANAPIADASNVAARAVWLRPSFGVHPWDAGNRTPEWKDRLAAQLDRTQEAAVGEIGLDRWILDRAKPDDPRLAGLRRAPLAEQIDVFRTQLAMAAERELPASIHCLDAFGGLRDVLRESPRPARGFLLHAYAGSAELAAEFVQLGAYFSFNGSFLDPRKIRLQRVYTSLPAERLLVETDAPAMPLPPEAERYALARSADGQRVNHPANLIAAYAGLASWRGVSVEELAAQVAQNFHTLFGL